MNMEQVREEYIKSLTRPPCYEVGVLVPTENMLMGDYQGLARVLGDRYCLDVKSEEVMGMSTPTGIVIGIGYLGASPNPAPGTSYLLIKRGSTTIAKVKFIHPGILKDFLHRFSKSSKYHAVPVKPKNQQYGQKDTVVRPISELGDEYALTCDTQDIEAILRHIGRGKDIGYYHCLFVKAGDGDYEEVWGTTCSVPYLNCYAELLYRGR